MPTLAWAGVDDARLDAACQEAVAGAAWSGAVVGVVDAHGDKRLRGCGHARTDGPPPDGQTRFEIGSATKVFTSLVLADLVVHKLVTLDDSLEKYLPASVYPPSWQGRRITLVDLATHTSGLPRLPGNLAPRDFADPYAAYGAAELYAFLGAYTLPRAPGERYEYSNLGAGLLGHVLALATRTSYAALVSERITTPLGMRATSLDDAPAEHASDGHAAGGAVVPPWHFDALAGAGAVRSDGDDMLTFVRAQLAPPPALAAAMALARKPRHAADTPGVEVALGWHLSDARQTIWHNGQTGGYHSYVAFDPARRLGVVVLANRADAPAERAGHALLDALRGNQPGGRQKSGVGSAPGGSPGHP